MKKQIALTGTGFLFLTLMGCMHNPELRHPHQTQNQGVAPQSVQAQKPVVQHTHPMVTAASSQPVVRAGSQKPTSTQSGAHYKNDIFYVNAYGQKHVQTWVDYFTGRGRGQMEKYLDRLPRYEALMKRILREEGVPEELIYIALIESGFNSKAYSRARAVGYWQFIRGTGKSYGLKQNWLIDERRDPIKSTRAAAQYFKALYKAFGSWHLAMSSYNAGEHRVLRAVMGNVTRDFWDLHKKKQLPKETRNYVPKFIAAAKIASQPGRYGFNHVAGQDPFAYQSVLVTKGISLSKFAQGLSVSLTELKRLNPSFKTDFVPIYRGSTTEVRVPLGTDLNLARVAATQSVSRKKYVASEGKSYHRVRRGDSLYRIARRYKTSVATLKRLNGLRRSSVIRPGMRIKLPGSLSKSRAKPMKYVKGSSYRVRRGDTLWSIAQKFGLSIGTLKSLNQLYSSKLRVGQILKVKPGGSSKATSKKVYYVKKGDNLTKIARSHGVALSKLIRQNGLRASSKLNVGARLRIPN